MPRPTFTVTATTPAGASHTVTLEHTTGAHDGMRTVWVVADIKAGRLDSIASNSAPTCEDCGRHLADTGLGDSDLGWLCPRCAEDCARHVPGDDRENFPHPWEPAYLGD